MTFDLSFCWIIAVCHRAYSGIAAIRWNCFLHEAGADIVTNYSTGTWNLKKGSGGKLGSGRDKVTHSQFKMDCCVWLEEETAQLMLNGCFYVRYITVLSSLQHKR